MSESLYDPDLLARSRAPQNTAPIADPVASARVDNRMCGDRVTVQLGAGPDPDRIGQVACQCKGCAVCMAAGSVMTDLVGGVERSRAASLAERIIAALGGGDRDDPMPDDLPEEIGLFWPVRRHPSRRRCATLPWEALRDALARMLLPGTAAAPSTSQTPGTATERPVP